MKPGLQIGDSREMTIRVTESMQAEFGGEAIHPLFSTASMIYHMEWVSRELVRPFLEPGEDGAGIHVDVRHLAPTPVGSNVTVKATVQSVTNKRVTCVVEAHNEHHKIGEGVFTQAILPKETLYGKMPSEPTSAATESGIPAARIGSQDGKQQFAIEFLKWETGILPCTRYDEWLICRIALNGGRIPVAEKGPFLLRHEIDEIIEAITALTQGKRPAFQSDFLEPAIKVRLEPAEPGEFQCQFQFSQPAISQLNTTNNATLRFEATSSELLRFARQLNDQLEGFPSRL